jgi:capsule polysaccharide export protein KpsE/RkpR
MTSTGVRQRPEPSEPPAIDSLVFEQELAAARERQVERMRLLWEHRRSILKAIGIGFLVSVVIALLIPNSYTSTAQLMPPDPQSSSALTMMSALLGKSGAGGFAGLTGDLLGLKSSGALFMGVLRSETSEDRIVQQLDLQRVYGTRLLADARKQLDMNTAISEDRKSGIITIAVTDRNAQRAAALTNAYVDELNSLVASLSTSAAHRERVFLEDRLKVAKVDLDEASNQLAQFSSKNSTLDLQTEGKAMLDAAATISGQLIVAESQLQGLRQIYTDNNPRVRSLEGRVNELRKQLEKFGGNPENSQAARADHTAAASTQVADPPSDKTSSSPFPTLRNLPLLGAKYSDYYRNAKIQETVYELLTEQYELAKVQEAKETPSVKVLDPGRVPERKSFPPRAIIVLVGTFFAFMAIAFWILGTNSWANVNPADPRKIFALEVAATIRSNPLWASQNGDAPQKWPQKVWSRLRSKDHPTDESSGSQHGL